LVETVLGALEGDFIAVDDDIALFRRLGGNACLKVSRRRLLVTLDEEDAAGEGGDDVF